MHIRPKVFRVDGEGELVGVDAFLVFSRHAVTVTDVGPCLAVVRVFVDKTLEKGDGFFLAVLAEEAVANLVVDSVTLVVLVSGQSEGTLIEIECEVIFVQTLVFVCDGIVEVEILVFVEVGQGVEVVVKGIFRLAQRSEATPQDEEIVRGVIFVAFDVLHDLKSVLGLAFQQVLAGFLDSEYAAFGVLLHGKVDSLA